MNTIARECRRASYDITKSNAKTLHTEILSVMGERTMTAREIAAELYNLGRIAGATRQDVQPRLTELEQLGRVIIIGKRLDNVTRRRVSAYRRVDND